MINILLDVLNAAEKKDYSGYSKFDALNSPYLDRLSLNNKWLRLIITQLVKESPFHVRPFLGVKPSRNPKGIALFARAHLILFERTGKIEHMKSAKSLLGWLLTHPSPDQSNLCWGYNYVWQSTIFLQERYEPNTVVTIFVGEALIHAYELTKSPKYLKAARSVAQFIIKDLPVIHQSTYEIAIAYVLRKVNAVVLNNQVLAGAFLVKVWKHTLENDLKEMATRLINYTVNRRTDYHAWYYTHPKGKSLIVHDNYHTGGILDGLLDFYEVTQDDQYNKVYWQGLEYYRLNLFTKDGAPKWMNNKVFPHDIHGAAQGIITFARASRHCKKYLDQCAKIVDWTIMHLYKSESKEFAYRKGRFMLWQYSLMRWCNAWMAFALAKAQDSKPIKF